MKDIVIIGASGLGREIMTILTAINKHEKKWNFLGFYDDAFKEEIHVIDGYNCLGQVGDLIEKTNKELNIIFGLANRRTVSNMYNSLKVNPNFKFPNIIHPNVIIETGFQMGNGNVITSRCSISCDVTLGDFNFINGMTILGHDVNMGSFNCLMPRVQISGNVIMDNYNFFGMNSSIVQDKKIGSDNTILAYSLLTKSIGSKRKYFGIPAKRVDI